MTRPSERRQACVVAGVSTNASSAPPQRLRARPGRPGSRSRTRGRARYADAQIAPAAAVLAWPPLHYRPARRRGAAPQSGTRSRSTWVRRRRPIARNALGRRVAVSAQGTRPRWRSAIARRASSATAPSTGIVGVKARGGAQLASCGAAADTIEHDAGDAPRGRKPACRAPAVRSPASCRAHRAPAAPGVEQPRQRGVAVAAVQRHNRRNRPMLPSTSARIPAVAAAWREGRQQRLRAPEVRVEVAAGGPRQAEPHRIDVVGAFLNGCTVLPSAASAAARPSATAWSCRRRCAVETNRRGIRSGLGRTSWRVVFGHEVEHVHADRRHQEGRAQAADRPAPAPARTARSCATRPSPKEPVATSRGRSRVKRLSADDEDVQEGEGAEHHQQRGGEVARSLPRGASSSANGSSEPSATKPPEQQRERRRCRARAGRRPERPLGAKARSTGSSGAARRRSTKRAATKTASSAPGAARLSAPAAVPASMARLHDEEHRQPQPNDSTTNSGGSRPTGTPGARRGSEDRAGAGGEHEAPHHDRDAGRLDQGRGAARNIVHR